MNKSCIRFEKAKIHQCDRHNFRHFDKGAHHIISELTPANEIWAAPDFESSQKLYAGLGRLVKEKTGRSLQSKASPVREAIVLMNPESTMEQVQNLTEELKRIKGLEAKAIFIHRDEGFFVPETESYKVSNIHAHIIFDCIDHTTGKTIKLNREDLSQFQDITAEIMQMERGERNSRHKHIQPHLFREQKALENALKAEQEANDARMELQIAQLAAEQAEDHTSALLSIRKKVVEQVNSLKAEEGRLIDSAIPGSVKYRDGVKHTFAPIERLHLDIGCAVFISEKGNWIRFNKEKRGFEVAQAPTEQQKRETEIRVKKHLKNKGLHM